MTASTRIPSDNLYKTITFAFGAVFLGAGGLWLVRLSPGLQQAAIRWITVVAGVCSALGALAWYRRTQRHLDRAQSGEPAHSDQSASSLGAVRPDSLDALAAGDPEDLGLPSLPNPTIQDRFAVWPIRFAVDLRHEKGTLTFALLGINYDDAPMLITRVALPYFRVDGEPIDFREEIARDGTIRIGPKEHFQFFVNKIIDQRRVRDLSRVRLETQYSGSLAVEVHYRRGDRLYSFSVASLSVPGVIERDHPAASSPDEQRANLS